MGQQDYDFFATGAPEPPPEPPVAKHARGPRQFTDPAGRVVNQFGTPVDVDAAPAGPAAAPGYGAQAYHGEGFADRGVGWDPVVPKAARSHAAPPGAYESRNERPGTTLAAGIIGIVQGAFGLLAGLVAWFAMSAIEQVVQDAGLSAAVTGLVRVVLVVVVVIAVGYLVAGIQVVRSKQWGGWMLLVMEAVGLLVGVLGMVSGSYQPAGGTLGQLLDLSLPAAVIVLLLLPGSRAWLQRR